MPDGIIEIIEDSCDFIIALQRKLVSMPALGPDNGGDGEKQKADYLLGELRELEIPEIRELNAPDERVSCGYRPNIAARFPGRDDSRTLWIISHMDVVPPGEPELWDGDPYELTVDGDTLIGRGVEDNHQGIAASMALARAVARAGVEPPIGLGVMLVSDEETGSEYGLKYIAREHSDLFGTRDLIIIPDYGVEDSSLIEIAEKSMLWLRVEVEGRQCHASKPNQGINSLRAAADMITRLDGLRESFPDTDPLFDPPESTFEPTKKEANVPNVNTIPGNDVFYLDCRVLPEYGLDAVVGAAEDVAGQIEAAHGVKVEITIAKSEQAAPATPVDSEVVSRLSHAIEDVYGVQARPGGIGGGTVAAVLREMGLPCAVWATSMHYAHQPNERAKVSSQIGDAKVLAQVLLGS
jgi:succinyl-diaminopimelate desuccinylase